VKYEMQKSQKKEDSFGYQELEELRLFIIKSPEIVKCEMLKSQKKEDNFGYQKMEESRPETLPHRSPKVLKREIVKCSFE
jgi:hypothetical protein